MRTAIILLLAMLVSGAASAQHTLAGSGFATSKLRMYDDQDHSLGVLDVAGIDPATVEILDRDAGMLKLRLRDGRTFWVDSTDLRPLAGDDPACVTAAPIDPAATRRHANMGVAGDLCR